MAPPVPRQAERCGESEGSMLPGPGPGPGSPAAAAASAPAPRGRRRRRESSGARATPQRRTPRSAPPPLGGALAPPRGAGGRRGAPGPRSGWDETAGAPSTPSAARPPPRGSLRSSPLPQSRQGRAAELRAGTPLPPPPPPLLPLRSAERAERARPGGRAADGRCLHRPAALRPLRPRGRHLPPAASPPPGRPGPQPPGQGRGRHLPPARRAAPLPAPPPPPPPAPSRAWGGGGRRVTLLGGSRWRGQPLPPGRPGPSGGVSGLRSEGLFDFGLFKARRGCR